jgi:hypothetical protein
MEYLGHLPQDDPLYGYLRYDILPQVGMDGRPPDFRVYRIKASNRVYLYYDRRSGMRIIGKFFGGTWGRSPEAAFYRMEREFHNLNHLRSIGFTGHPHYVARPLGRNASLDCVLVVEFVYGTPLDNYILKAIQGGARDDLFQKLTAIAYLLATLHNRSAIGIGVDFHKDCAYFDRITEQLEGWGHIGWEESRELRGLKDRWRVQGCMWEDQQVLVHGDVTPTNILLGDGIWVILVDLERMKLADRVFDVGRIAGEIKHFTGISDPYEAPEQPEVVVHTATETPEQSVERIWAKLKELELISFG